jgi:hypothetical protein
MFIPYGAANDTIANWQPEPQTRGTFSILSSCILTLGLCVWTAVHLNVPKHKHVKLQVGWKVGWLIIGMFAPEMVLVACELPVLKPKLANLNTDSVHSGLPA